MRRKWEKGDFVYFSSHNFLLELSALCGSKKLPKKPHGVRAWVPPSRKRERPEWLWRRITERTENTEKKKTDKWQMTNPQ
jgi:hypothetical protein